MRRRDDDLLRVPESQYGSLTQDELLRLVVICRNDRSTKKQARKAWEMLIALDIDRVRGLVASFRFPNQPGVRVKPTDVDDAVQTAFERLVKMLKTFRGTSEGEFRAAMRRCVGFACMDHCRAAMNLEKPIEGSLDDEWTDSEGNSRGKFEPDMANRERRRLQDEESLERAVKFQAAVAAAIAELDGNRRVVIEMTRDGRPTEEIAARLETSADNVYKLRERGLKALREILDGDGQP